MKELIEQIEYRNKGKLLAVKPYSSNSGDYYLHVVLIKKTHDPSPHNLPTLSLYVVWIFNSHDSGFFDGHYHSTLSEALETFNTLGHIAN